MIMVMMMHTVVEHEVVVLCHRNFSTSFFLCLSIALKCMLHYYSKLDAINYLKETLKMLFASVARKWDDNTTFYGNCRSFSFLRKKAHDYYNLHFNLKTFFRKNFIIYLWIYCRRCCAIYRRGEDMLIVW